MYFRAILAASLVAASVSTAAAQTDGYLLACSAAAQLGRGCVSLAAPHDPATLLSNPASLAASPSRQLQVSGAAFLPAMDYRNAVNPLTAGKNNVFPLPALFLADRARGPVTVGLGVQTLGGMGADYTLTHALLGPGQRYHSKFALMKGGIGAALRLTDRLSLGGTLGALYGQLEFATPYAVNPAQLAGLAGLGQDPSYATLLANFHEAVAYAALTGLSGFGLTGGASAEYRASERLRVAAMWTAPSTLRMSGGRATMDMNAQFGQLYQGMVAAKSGDTATVNAQLRGMGITMASGMATAFDARVDFGVPQTFTLALGLEPAPRWSLGVDVGWIGWKHAFRAMPLAMTGGSNANINIMMNGSPTNGAFATEWPMQWKDAWTARVGAEFEAGRALTLRAGGIYGTNPVPSGTLFTIFPAIVENAATVGLGYSFGTARVDLTYALTFRNSQTAAAPHLVASEYAGSTSRLAESTISAGLTVRM